MALRARVFRLAGAILACLPALLAACTTPPGVSTPLASASNSPGNSTLTASNLPRRGVQFLAWGTSAQLQAYQSLVAAYDQSFPGQAVDLVTLPSQADDLKRLTADFAAGAPPDVMVLSYLDVPGLASKKLLSPVAPYLAASHVITADSYFEQTLGPFTYNRQLQCLPQDASGLVVYYNRHLFQQAGLPEPGARWNWDQFLADARALTRDTNAGGQPHQYGLGLERTLSTMAPFMFQNKGELVDDRRFPSELTLNTPEVLTATAWLVALQVQYHVVPDSQAELANSSEQRFVDGTLGMFIGTRSGVPVYRKITAFDWAVAPLPSLNGRTSNVVLADGLCLAAASSHKAAAWRFIEFVGSAAGQSILAKSGAFVPALISAAKSADFLDPAERPAHSQVFLDALAQGTPLPLLANWSDIQAIADEELQQAFYGHKDVALALAAATTRSEEYFIIHASP
jgi:multiple sugar transport system substrate-binding protein